MHDGSKRLPFTEHDIRVSFAAREIARGLSYARTGRVLRPIREGKGGALEAGVRGTRVTPYNVTLRFDWRGARTHIVGQCTCPVGWNCKHAAAVAYAALFDIAHEPRRSPSPAAAAVTDRVRDDVLEARVIMWLEDIERASGRAPADMEATGAEAVAYLFGGDPRPAAGRIAFPFVPIVMRRLKSGAWSKIRDCSVESLAGGASRSMTPADALIGRFMSTVEGARQTAVATVYDDILRRVVVTGRARLGHPTGPALRLGEPRTATFAWTVAADGRQRPTVAADDPAVTILHGFLPWYLDARAAEIGPLETGIPRPILAALLGAPPLAPSMARAVAEKFAGRFAHLALPAPPVVTETVRAIAPVPTLVLRTVPLPISMRYAYDATGESAAIDLAEVTFAYGGVRADPDDEASEIRRIDGTETIVHPRDLAAESRALQRLARYLFYSDKDARRLVPSPALVLRSILGEEDGWATFAHAEVPKLRAEGWDVEIDPSFRHRVLDVGASDAAWDPRIEDGANGWFDVSIGLDVEGRRVELLPILRDLIARGAFTPKAFASGVETLGGPASAGGAAGVVYVRLGGEAGDVTLAFPADRLRAIVTTLVELGDPSTADAGRLRVPRTRLGVLGELEAASGLRWDAPDRVRALASQLRDFSGIRRVPVPKAFRGELRAYQREGLDWLQFLRAYGFGGILADDMGLGKSVQTIAHILGEKQAGRLTQPALIVVPTSLVFNWCDELARFAPTLRVVTLHGLDRATRLPQLARADVAITTYALLARDAVFTERPWQLVVLDEAQFLKNPQAKAAQAAMRLQSEHRIALTGTPVENHLGDLWSLFAIVLPGALGDRTQFGRLFRTPIEKRADADRRRALADRIRPFVLRRTKEHVASELPEKLEIVRRVELAGAQRDLYETVRVAMHARVQEEIARSGLARSQIVILDALLKLRQVCCDPRLLPERFKANAASAKLDVLTDMLPEMIEEGRRVLLFSQFTSMLDLIAPELETRGIPFVMLTGKSKDRAASVKRFSSGDVPVFLISLKAGGTGLNLTAADTVIHYDPWWNPAVERQATDRAHRIGQTKRVFVYKLIGAETVEEKIVDLQRRKAGLAAAIFAEKPSAGAAFSRDDIARLFSPIK